MLLTECGIYPTRLINGMLVPQLILMSLVYLSIAEHLEWNSRIITIDEYMLGGWMAGLFGALVQVSPQV